MFTLSLGRVFAGVAVLVFVLAAIGEWPADLQEDAEPVALGLAFLAASFVAP
jgi:hypothetical protein